MTLDAHRDRTTIRLKLYNSGGDPKYLVQQECLRRGFIKPENVQGDRCDAIALWTHMAAEQLPSLKYVKSNIFTMRRAG